MVRIRERSAEYPKISFNKGVSWSPKTQVVQRFSELYYPGSTPCTHIKMTSPFTGQLIFKSNNQEYVRVENYFENPDLILTGLSSFISERGSQLNSRKLPSNTEFRILQFLAELDETLLIFTRKFWQSLSYGSFTWGLVPFVNDIKAILSIIQSFEEFFSTVSYEDEYELALNSYEYNRRPDTVSTLTGSIVARHTGKVNMGDLGAEKWLDALGFFPDLGTFWDLVPLSFVVNWLIPVGSFLESFREGWVTHISFSGWSTYHCIGSSVRRTTIEGPYIHDKDWISSDFEVFIRAFDTRVLEVPPMRPVSGFELPSLVELFNILYIFVLSKRR